MGNIITQFFENNESSQPGEVAEVINFRRLPEVNNGADWMKQVVEACYMPPAETLDNVASLDQYRQSKQASAPAEHLSKLGVVGEASREEDLHTARIYEFGRQAQREATPSKHLIDEARDEFAA